MNSFANMHNDYLDPDRSGFNDDHPDNEHVKAAFADHDGPSSIYRAAYKYTACGPGIGVKILEWVEDVSEEPTYEMRGEDYVQTGTHLVGGSRQVSRNVYCDDLYKLGSWADMDKKGQLITQFMIDSIVEGVDQCCSTVEVPALYGEIEDLVKGDESVSDVLHRLFWAGVEEVNNEAGEIWDATHGCDTCAQHWADDSGVEIEVVTEEWDSIPVWKKCPDCGGHGIPI